MRVGDCKPRFRMHAAFALPHMQDGSYNLPEWGYLPLSCGSMRPAVPISALAVCMRACGSADVEAGDFPVAAKLRRCPVCDRSPRASCTSAVHALQGTHASSL